MYKENIGTGTGTVLERGMHDVNKPTATKVSFSGQEVAFAFGSEAIKLLKVDYRYPDPHPLKKSKKIRNPE